jgi:hypothetical protein
LGNVGSFGATRCKNCSDDGADHESKRRDNQEQKAFTEGIAVAQQPDERHSGNEPEGGAYYRADDAE